MKKTKVFLSIPSSIFLTVLFLMLLTISGYFWLSNNQADSVELGIASPSPLGEEYGLAIPASCPSDLHDDPTYGLPCAACNATCGLCNAGTYDCGGVCNVGAPPCLVSGLTATCNAAGNQVTLSWNPSAGADDYYVRMDYPPNNSGFCTGGWLCSTPPDYASNLYAGTSINVPVSLPGTHNAWVHSHNAYNTQPPTSISFACNELRICPTALNMGMGTVYQMRAFYLLGGVDCNSLGPAQDVSNLVTWASSAPAIATVGNNPIGGRINAGFTTGTTNITISSYAGKIAPPSTVTVVGGYAICPTSPSTYSGGTTQLRAYYSALTPVDCSNLTGSIDVTGSVTWTSADTGIATVSAGTVAGVSSGSVSITTSPYNGVTPQPVTVTVGGGYKICPTSAIVGSTGFPFHSYYNPSGAVNCGNLAGTTDVTGSVTWTSSNPGVATVGNGGSAGIATPVSLGSSNISTTPYTGIPSGNAVATVICIPSVSCVSPGPAATAANTCPSQTFTIDDGCGYPITCSGTRTCDFNWKEVSQ